MECVTPGFPVLHYLPEFAQTHVFPLSQWYHLTISFSVTPFSCSQSFPATESFPMSQLFATGGQRIRALASVLLINIQDWFPLRLTGLISLQSKGHYRNTVQKHQLRCSAFFMVQLSHPYMTTWKNHSFDYMHLCQQSDVSGFLICCLGWSQLFFQEASIFWFYGFSHCLQWFLEPKKIKSVTASTFSPSIHQKVMQLDSMILVFWMLF